jgi:hypothetical protein
MGPRINPEFSNEWVPEGGSRRRRVEARRVRRSSSYRRSSRPVVSRHNCMPRLVASCSSISRPTRSFISCSLSKRNVVLCVAERPPSRDPLRLTPLPQSYPAVHRGRTRRLASVVVVASRIACPGHGRKKAPRRPARWVQSCGQGERTEKDPARGGIRTRRACRSVGTGFVASSIVRRRRGPLGGACERGNEGLPRDPRGAVGQQKGIGRVGSTNHSVTSDVTAGP